MVFFQICITFPFQQYMICLGYLGSKKLQNQSKPQTMEGFWALFLWKHFQIVPENNEFITFVGILDPVMTFS